MYNQSCWTAFHLRKYYGIDNQKEVEIAALEQIIIDTGYDIRIRGGLQQPFILKKTLFVPHISGVLYRCLLAHEIAHITCHHFNQFYADGVTIRQCEYRADQFAACLLMGPPFDQDIKTNDLWELTEIYGVTQEMACMRVRIIGKAVVFQSDLLGENK